MWAIFEVKNIFNYNHILCQYNCSRDYMRKNNRESELSSARQLKTTWKDRGRNWRWVRVPFSLEGLCSWAVLYPVVGPIRSGSQVDLILTLQYRSSLTHTHPEIQGSQSNNISHLSVFPHPTEVSQTGERRPVLQREKAGETTQGGLDFVGRDHLPIYSCHVSSPFTLPFLFFFLLMFFSSLILNSQLISLVFKRNYLG